VTSAPKAPFCIELFDAARHGRNQFSCGITQVDNYFKKTGNKLAEANNIRLYVMTAASGELIGFYAINAHAVDYENLPKRYARTRPSHGQIPAAYISMLGRDQRYSGMGFGSDLLADALLRIARVAETLGVAVIMLDVLNCGDRERISKRKQLYERYGFMPLISSPLRLFLPVSTVQDVIKRTDETGHN
jgi:ribosomal protein S18 acetylase RimI-like enzyme